MVFQHTVSISTFPASQTNDLLAQNASSKRQPCLGRFAVEYQIKYVDVCVHNVINDENVQEVDIYLQCVQFHLP